MGDKNVIVIAGPTATGKTQTSLELSTLCEKYPCEIVNFDSLLFYKELNIGTAKPTAEELSIVPHHLVNTHSISRPINAADFSKLALPIIEAIHNNGKSAILVGGSGFYLQALLNGMYESETTSQNLIERSNKLYNDKGIEPFREILKEFDLKSYERYHENDHYRIRRAVEHYWMTGTPLSKARAEMDSIQKFAQARRLGWNLKFFYLDIPKMSHFEIISKRAKKMVESGLITEVKDLLKSGFTGNEKPLSSIGYKETLDYLNDSFDSQEQYIERLAINTRQLAKAQRTWFKKLELDSYNPLSDNDKIKENFKSFLER